MAFQNISNLAQGNLLQVMFTNGVRNQISEDFRDFEYVSKLRVGKSAPREIKFMLQDAYGSAAVGFRNPGSSQSFPIASKASVSEKTAYMKEIAVTVEVDYNLYDRARTTPEKYLAPLALEMQSKSIAAKRTIAAAFQGDGTGVIGTAASVVDTAAAAGSGKAVVTLVTAWTTTLRGHVGLFEEGDLYLCKNADGTVDNPTVTGTFYAWQCTEKDRDNNAVTLKPIDSSGNYLALTLSSIDAGDVFYRVTQGTFADLTGSISDYGTVSEVLAGLGSLGAADGRTIWGVQMSGATAASQVNAAGALIDVSHVQAGLDKAKLRTGGVFKYKMMAMSPETQAALINARESDRRFVQADDNKRGVKFMAFQHGSDLLETYTSEFVRKNQIWCLPETAQGGKVLELYGTDFEAVKGEDMSIWHLKPNASGYDAAMQSFLKSNMTIVGTRPAAIVSIVNFVNV